MATPGHLRHYKEIQEVRQSAVRKQRVKEERLEHTVLQCSTVTDHLYGDVQRCEDF